MLPEVWTSTEIILWICRFLGGLTFIVWPGVLIAGIMASAAHVSKETPWTSFVRFLWILSIGYPIYFVYLWKWADGLKATKPLLAIALTAVPVVAIYGAVGWNSFDSWFKERKTAEMVEVFQNMIITGLQEKDYPKAFGIFFDEKRSSQAYILENHKSGFNFREEVEKSLADDKPSKEFVEHLIRYAFGSLKGATNVHWAYLDPNDPIAPTDMSLEILRLLEKWKKSGVHFADLPEHQQWVWDHVELYTDHKLEDFARKKMEKENPLIAEVSDFFGSTKEIRAIFEKYPKDLLNKKGEIFGTPLHALLLQEQLDPNEKNRIRIRILREVGGKLHPSEETPKNLATLQEVIGLDANSP